MGDRKCEHGRVRRKCPRCATGLGPFNLHVANLTKKGLANELTPDRFKWLATAACVYCGLPATGVDRVKNEYGYTTLNSVPCCGTCNKMKLTASAPDFLEHVRRIVGCTPNYAVFKQRWITARTEGPDLVPHTPESSLDTEVNS